MRKFLILSVFILSGSLQAFSCDVCGCQLGGLSYGILPQHLKSFVGLRYSHASFRAQMDHDSEYFDDEHSNDTYQRIDLMGRISLASWLQVNVQLPYLINSMDGSHQKVRSSGIGDPLVLVYFTPINTGDDVSDWRNSLMVGGGIKLPFGEYQKEDDGLIINRNFQLGSGSVDYLMSLNYTVSYRDWGLNAEASYKANGTNDQDYRFGNQFNTSLYAFRYLEVATVSLLPFIGAYYEIADRHKDGKVIQINTGGSALFGTVGTQVYRNRLALLLQYQVPLAQRYNSDDIATIEAGSRLSASLLFNFSFRKMNQAKGNQVDL